MTRTAKGFPALLKTFHTYFRDLLEIFKKSLDGKAGVVILVIVKRNKGDTK